jgi:parallel beta-helix repeat protein
MNLLPLFFLITSPLRIYDNTTLPPNGEYHQPVIIMADNIVFDCSGSSFIGDKTGVGILIQRHNGVTVRNCKVRNFDVGIYAMQGRNLVFERNDTSGNYVDDDSIIEDLKPYPHGGMILNAVQRSRVAGNSSNGNLHGIQVLNSSRIALVQNTTSKNRGWGIYFYSTTASQVFSNTVDYNNRSCPQWGKDAGCGSAGIVMTQQSDRNQIGWNTLRYNGDGIYQGNTPESASNNLEMFNNSIANNVANGIEATFSIGNYIHHNSFDGDNYGAWLGYAQYVRFEFNSVRNARTKSVQADNGQFIQFVGNTFDGADVLLQPVDGGVCKGNSESNDKYTNASWRAQGCSP